MLESIHNTQEISNRSLCGKISWSLVFLKNIIDTVNLWIKSICHNITKVGVKHQSIN